MIGVFPAFTGHPVFTTQSQPTQALLSRIRQGDRSAWEDLDQKYRNRLRLIARSRIPTTLRRHFDTDDLCQSTLVSAFSELDRFEFRGPGSFEGWLVALMSNNLRSKLRSFSTLKRSRHREEHPEDSSLEHLNIRSREPDPVDIASTADLYARVVMITADMDGEQADLLSRHFVGGESYTDIAKSYGKSESTVRRMIAQAFLDLNLRLKSQSE